MSLPRSKLVSHYVYTAEGVIYIRKEFEFQGCVEVPVELSEDESLDKFIDFIEANGWSFGGGINTIVDGFYINHDGTKGKYVLDE